MLDGGPGKDGIPAKEFPLKNKVGDPANQYLEDDDLVLGFQHNGEIIAYPFGDYKTNSTLLFPVRPLDDHLHPKERILAVIRQGTVKVYRSEQFRWEALQLRDLYTHCNSSQDAK